MYTLRNKVVTQSLPAYLLLLTRVETHKVHCFTLPLLDVYMLTVSSQSIN
jgi:hypothetical protein